MGHADLEIERLQLQASIIGGVTRRLVQECGVRPGMRQGRSSGGASARERAAAWFSTASSALPSLMPAGLGGCQAGLGATPSEGRENV
jgi:hypothetical protein